MDKPRLLAHICCAPDAAYVIRLLAESFDVSGFFYNPNIHPPEEYALRLEEARRVAAALKIVLIEEEFDESRWLRLTEKHKDEPEKGRRCDICYAMRLERTARAASAGGFDYFTTVMSLSPWKKADVLNRIGRMFGRRFRVRFFEADFKEKDGFRKSVELSKDLGLYRQDYCGCLYSRRDHLGRIRSNSNSKVG
jgi:predicted adenine nucleotide alpha hydrolase (AANH) superfamily ATPase